VKLRVSLGILLFSALLAAQRYPVSGMVVKVDPPLRTMVVSHGPIAGFMDAMVMPFHVREAAVLAGMQPGMKVDFTLVVDKESSYADDVRVASGDSVARDPLQARRLQLLDSLVAGLTVNAVAIGQPMPDFQLTDQSRREVRFSQFSGKVVAVNFIYTRCPLPDYCLRLSNNFARLQKRFSERMGRDLVLLSVTFDPKYDQPDVLAAYARTWKADPEAWHFLTGPPRICAACTDTLASMPIRMKACSLILCAPPSSTARASSPPSLRGMNFRRSSSAIWWKR